MGIRGDGAVQLPPLRRSIDSPSCPEGAASRSNSVAGAASRSNSVAGAGDSPTGSSPKSSAREASSPRSPGCRRAKDREAVLLRRHAFLKKRCNGRWGYCEELRTFLFEDFFDEDASQRPAAADVFELPRARELFERYGFLAVAGPSEGETSAIVTGHAADGDVQQSSSITNSLKVLTPESFYSALCLEKARSASKESTDSKR